MEVVQINGLWVVREFTGYTGFATTIFGDSRISSVYGPWETKEAAMAAMLVITAYKAMAGTKFDDAFSYQEWVPGTELGVTCRPWEWGFNSHGLPWQMSKTGAWRPHVGKTEDGFYCPSALPACFGRCEYCYRGTHPVTK